MNSATRIIRYLLGLIVIIFGLNKFLHFLPAPEMTGNAAVYFGGLMASGFTIPTIAMVEILVGIALLTNKFVSLALVLLAPISVNILLYHLFLDLPNIPIGGAVFAFNLILLFSRKKDYAAVLTA